MNTPEAPAFIGTNLDLMVIIIYFALMLVLGLWFGRYTRTTKDFFFGGQRFAWWLIAFSCVATTVGSYSFQKYSAAGFSYGVSSTQTYLNDWFWMPIVILIWLPMIYYQRMSSIPEYFERRFGKGSRIAATGIILTYLLAYIGINLYTVGKVLHALLGWDPVMGAAITTIAVTLYVFVGGQTSVIMTDLVQGIILLVAGLGVFLAGIYHFGGFGNFWELLPQGHKYAFSEFAAPDKFSFVGIYAQDGLVNTGAFMLMNQGIIMRFLSLKSMKDTTRMAVCWVLVLAPLAALATSGPGWLARALVENGELETTASDAFVHASHFLCSPGVFGFVLAAVVAALMSTADTLINAVSAIFVNDIWRRFVKPEAGDKHHLRVARITSLCAAGVGLALVPFYATDTVYQAHAMVTASIPAPLVVAILLAIFWRRYTPAAALATLVGGTFLVALSVKFPEQLVAPFSFGMGSGSYKFMRALYGLTVCGLLGVIVSLFTKPKPVSEIVGLVTGTQLDAIRMFKGGEANRRPGKKVRLKVVLDTALKDVEETVLPQSALDAMAADPGDILYACDKRWWYGGLKSVHLRAGETADAEEIRLSQEALDTAHFVDGQEVVIEKII